MASYFDALPDAANQTLPLAPPPLPGATAMPTAPLPGATATPTSPPASSPQQGSYLSNLPDAADQSAGARVAATVGSNPTRGDQTNTPNPVGVDDFGRLIYDESTPEGAAANKQTGDIAGRIGEKMGEGLTFGTLPYGVAAARTVAGVPFKQGLQQARDYTAQTSAEAPFVSMVAEGVGSTPWALAAPEITALRALPTIGKAAPIVEGTLTGGAIGAASAAGHDIGSGQTANIGSDTMKGGAIGAGIGGAAPVVGMGLQAIPNVGRSIYSGLSNLLPALRDANRDAVAGQVLREAAPNGTTPMAKSPLPDLRLRTAQATGDPGLAALERKIATPPDVQSGMTSDQAHEVAKALVGPDAAIPGQVLVNQASANGVKAIHGVDTALGNVENALWSDPAMQGVKLNGPGIANGVTQDVSQFPAQIRDAVTGPQAKLGGYLREINELGPNASIQDLNSIRSRLLSESRSYGFGATPDLSTARAASSMADSLLTRIGADPAIAGTPAQTIPRGWVTNQQGVPVWSDGATIPETPPNSEAWAAYQKARDFSRQYNQTLGYPEFDSILNPNSAGNIAGNPEKQFGRFYDINGGTGAGLMRLNNAVQLARQYGQSAEAQELEDAAKVYLKTAILRGAQNGSQVDREGRPIINMPSIASAVTKVLPAVNATPIFADSAQDLQSVGNAAELLNRPQVSRGNLKSPTYENLAKNDVIPAFIGKAGSTALGAGIGGYMGYEHLPEEIPWYLRLGLGMTAGGFTGKAITHIPGFKDALTGTEDAVIDRITRGLATPEDYQRLRAIPALNNRTLFQHGGTQAVTQGAIRATIPQTSETSHNPSINPATGLPQYNLHDAQNDQKRRVATQVVQEMRDRDVEAFRQWMDSHKQELRKILGGQGLNRIMQVSSLIRRSGNVFSIVANRPTKALRAALGGDDIAAHAILKPALIKVLAMRSGRSDLTKSGEAQVVNALLGP